MYKNQKEYQECLNLSRDFNEILYYKEKYTREVKQLYPGRNDLLPTHEAIVTRMLWEKKNKTKPSFSINIASTILTIASIIVLSPIILIGALVWREKV